MYCRNSITLHLARGVGAIILILALFLMNLHPMINILLLLGIILLLRGCPTCWFIGLISKLKTLSGEVKK